MKKKYKKSRQILSMTKFTLKSIKFVKIVQHYDDDKVTTRTAEQARG